AEMPVMEIFDDVRIEFQSIVVYRVGYADHLGVEEEQEHIILISQLPCYFRPVRHLKYFLVKADQFFGFVQHHYHLINQSFRYFSSSSSNLPLRACMDVMIIHMEKTNMIAPSMNSNRFDSSAYQAHSKNTCTNIAYNVMKRRKIIGMSVAI